MPDPDAADARLARGGDAHAFARLVDRYARRVHDLARRMLRDAHEAEDVAQQAFLNAWRAMDRFDPERPFRNWMLRIASNLCRNRLAARQRALLLRARGGDDPVPEPAAEGPPAPGEAVPTVREAIERLPERYRLPVILHYVHHRPLADIAAITDVPVATVKTWLHRGRAALRDLLAEPDPSGETPPPPGGTTPRSPDA